VIVAGSRMARGAVAALDAIGRARLARDRGIAARAHRLHAACAEIAHVHGLELDIRGEWPSGPAVLVPNHVGYLDAIAVAASLPCVPIAKAEVAGWPVIGTAACRLGAIFVVRDSAWSRVRALRSALAALQAGVPVLNFPEGTTTDGTRLQPFMRGIFGLARLAGVPVVPVAIRCPRELAWHGGARFVPHYVKFASTPAPHLRLDVLPAIDATGFASADELAELTYLRLSRELGFSQPRVLRFAS
jgi:1-acyl-sn-glycerol-3-phosphate acyltransferase